MAKKVDLIITEKQQEELNAIRRKLGFKEEPIKKNMKVGCLIG